MNDTDWQEGSIVRLPFDELLLDDENPRLPERLHGQPQSEILRYLYEQGALEELAYSYRDNGFFPQEPLLVVERDEEDTYTVVEGNRRLAALKILHGCSEADDIGFPGIELSAERLDSLREIPCVPIADRNQIHAYVGFRHIGGLKTWPPEAKARYLLAEVHRLVDQGFADPLSRAWPTGWKQRPRGQKPLSRNPHPPSRTGGVRSERQLRPGPSIRCLVALHELG